MSVFIFVFGQLAAVLWFVPNCTGSSKLRLDSMACHLHAVVHTASMPRDSCSQQRLLLRHFGGSRCIRSWSQSGEFQAQHIIGCNFQSFFGWSYKDYTTQIHTNFYSTYCGHNPSVQAGAQQAILHDLLCRERPWPTLSHQCDTKMAMAAMAAVRLRPVTCGQDSNLCKAKQRQQRPWYLLQPSGDHDTATEWLLSTSSAQLKQLTCSMLGLMTWCQFSKPLCNSKDFERSMRRSFAASEWRGALDLFEAGQISLDFDLHNLSQNAWVWWFLVKLMGGNWKSCRLRFWPPWTRVLTLLLQ